ncbi:hypothetical protein D3C85_1921680 [compost metagenome]
MYEYVVFIFHKADIWSTSHTFNSDCHACFDLGVVAWNKPWGLPADSIRMAVKRVTAVNPARVQYI